jgi:hypothetical protein
MNRYMPDAKLKQRRRMTPHGVLKQNHHQDNSKMQILVRTPTSCVRRQYVVTNPSIPEYLEMNSARGAKVRR